MFPTASHALILTSHTSSTVNSSNIITKVSKKILEDINGANFSNVMHIYTLLRHSCCLINMSCDNFTAHVSLFYSERQLINSGIVSTTPCLTSYSSFKKIINYGSRSYKVISGPKILAISCKLKDKVLLTFGLRSHTSLEYKSLN